MSDETERAEAGCLMGDPAEIVARGYDTVASAYAELGRSDEPCGRRPPDA